MLSKGLISQNKTTNPKDQEAVSVIQKMIEDIILISAWCWGIHCAFSEGFIMEKPGLFIERILGTEICRPLFLCPPCMASVHGIAWGLFFYGLTWKLIPFVVALCGLNYILKSFIYPEYEEPVQEK